MMDVKGMALWKTPGPRKHLSRANYALSLGVVAALCIAFYKCKLFGPLKVGDSTVIVLEALKDNCAGEWSKKYTSEPHLPGTNYGFVEWTRDKFEEYGWMTEIDSYDVYVSYPESHDLKLLDNEKTVIYQAPLREDVIPEDATSGGNDTVPTFLAYGANGNVTAEYVYANYGTKEDFSLLKEMNVSMEGKIAIVRYGSIFRGLKVQFAQENGAVGVLLYSDPGNDFGVTPANGFKQYPHGPARQESSVQRGSVQFSGGVGATPGDPTTPGYASKGNVKRMDPYSSIGKIPVLPISYREVTPILKMLNRQGQKAPREWIGELEGFDYYIGPNPNMTLNLYSNQTFKITPLWNVYAEIEGKRKDEAIIIGNHRDAWIKGGAGDPNSGSATLIEIARALGSLKKSGYEFERTIILQSYDGEEYGLLGSTEYGEYAAKRLQKNVIAYLNMDSAAISRFLRLRSSPVLNRVLRKVAKWIPYPGQEADTLYDHLVKEMGDKITNLGSGSDYTVFLEHLGIPCADVSFVQGKGDGIYHYHSNYDSYDWMLKYGDKDFLYHNAAAKYLALVALELTRHKVIDFSVSDYADDLSTYFNQLEQEVPQEWFSEPVTEVAAEEYLNDQDHNEAFIRDVTERSYRYKKQFMFPELLLPAVCKRDRGMRMCLRSHDHLTFGDFFFHTKRQLERFKETAKHFDEKSEALQIKYDKKDTRTWWQRLQLRFQISRHNTLLKYFERNFLYTHGLHERTWYKHMVFASGRYTGYAGQTWPGIREAIEDRDIDRAVKWLGLAAKAVKRITAQME